MDVDDQNRVFHRATPLHGPAAAHRSVVVFAGEREWCREKAVALLSGFSRPLWLSDHPREGGPTGGGQLLRLLGGEIDAIVFDAHGGFDVEAFGAAAGMVRGGGLFLLLTPPLERWPRFPDPEHRRLLVHPWRVEEISGRFLQRLARLIGSEGIAVYTQGSEESLPSLEPLLGRSASPRPDGDGEGRPWRGEEQRLAVEAIMQRVSDHQPRPLVLTADRGRGKSAALGIAAALLLRAAPVRIVVTAPRFGAAATLFDHFGRINGADRHPRLEFVPPDALIESPRAADLLLVDEAAAIPLPLLERLLERYPRAVFATTLHGYEGTGRGFAARFFRLLDARAPGWLTFRLERPLRWRADDPLERFVARALLIDPDSPAGEEIGEATPGRCTVERLDRDRLAADEPLLREIFGLLALAHYRTSPLDLRHLLDGPNLEVRALRFGERMVGTALVAREGGFDPLLAEAVADGLRRPRGHLLPQSLAAHLGLEKAPVLTADRIVRVAVHPAVQGRGLGRMLVEALIAEGREAGRDYIGSSFGATEPLLRFWRGAGFAPVRLGITREPSSGAYSVMLLRPLSAAGRDLVEQARDRFTQSLPLLLADPLRGMEGALAEWFRTDLPPADGSAGAMGPQDWKDLVAVAFGRRDYETAMAPVRRLVRRALEGDDEGGVTGRERALLSAKVMRHGSWGEVAAELGFSGRPEATRALREALARLVRRYGDAAALERADRLARAFER